MRRLHASVRFAVLIGMAGLLGVCQALAGGLADKSSVAWAQAVPEARADIRGVYDFEPVGMSFDEQAKRAPAISALWDRYTQNPDVYAEALRSELQAPGNRELLYCDGGMLLLNKSKRPDDQALGLASLERCSLAEIQQTPYFYTLHALALRGVDTFDLQIRMLSKPRLSVFIVRHALTLGLDYAFLYPLLVQDEEVYVPRLLKRLSEERDPVAQNALVLALWYAATDAGEAAIRQVASEEGIHPTVKATARSLIEKLDTVRQWKPNDETLKRLSATVEMNSKTTEVELRAKRRTRMRSISDEALHDLEAYTVLIYRARSGN